MSAVSIGLTVTRSSCIHCLGQISMAALVYQMFLIVQLYPDTIDPGLPYTI